MNFIMLKNDKKKHLSEMTSAELGQLFPIIISEPNPEWRNMFHIEKTKIIRSLGDQNLISIEHIGSTAIPGIKAKPTIDILIEIPEEAHLNFIIKKITALDYYYISQPENPPPHMMFAKGYTTKGYKGQAFHIHVRYKGDWDELHFRDYLLTHPEEVRKYEKLKLELAEKYKNDRDEYTNQKGDFINRINKQARKI